ncbi:unnamed protein product [Ixodes pacificus]
MRVCSRHFTRSYFSWSTIGNLTNSPQKRRLRKGALPSTCLPVRTHERRAGAAQLRAQEARARRAAPRQDVPQLATNSPPPPPSSSDCSSPEVETSARATPEDLEVAQMLLDLTRPVQEPLAQKEVAQDKAVQVNTSTAPVQNQRLSDLLTTDASVRAYTGVESMALLNAIVRCAEKIHSQTSELTMREKVILVLTKIKTNLSFTCLAINFNISKASTSRYFHTTLQILSRILKASLPWPSKYEVVNNLPRCFQNFANVRVVLDGTEIKIEKAACLAYRIWTYSHYKEGTQQNF